ncbi:hypothetical protein [Bizionia psychrotolerans]|uniref:hypothetical protein n=1 Tax=Bizionia psychrotolerans TaxID=1492901 RepID=UPI000651385E|nr:hypothetical protein [Bizionia psychrotolerans]
MIKKVLTFILLITFINTSFGQITSDKEATESLNWIIENPQIESDSIFTNKSAEIFKWYASNNPQVEMRVSGISEFMDSSKSYKFFKEIIMIYTLSEIDNQISRNVDKNESSLLAISNVLKFYERIIKIDENYKNSVLQKYSALSEKDLKKQMKKLQ